MSELIERLRELASETGTFGADAAYFGEAADTITRLQEENEKLKTGWNGLRIAIRDERAKLHQEIERCKNELRKGSE